MTFEGETEHFSGKNGALTWIILVGKQKHNVQKPMHKINTKNKCQRHYSSGNNELL